jgi:hypothetical protein
MSAILIPAAVSVGSASPTTEQHALFPQRADELRSFLLDLPATGSVMLPIAQDICDIAFRLIRQNKSIVIFTTATGVGYQEAPVPAGPCIALRDPTEDEVRAMALLAAHPNGARDMQALTDQSAMIRRRCRDPSITGSFPVCLATISAPHDSVMVMDGFFFFRE